MLSEYYKNKNTQDKCNIYCKSCNIEWGKKYKKEHLIKHIKKINKTLCNANCIKNKYVTSTQNAQLTR